MKKLLPLILTCTLALTACTAAPDATPLSTPAPTPEPTATPAPVTTDFYALNTYDGRFNSGDAYYEFVQKLGYCLLVKTDYATATQTVCCEIPGCTHDTDACPAYFPGKYPRYNICASPDALYVWHVSFFYQEKSWDDYYAESVAPRIANPDISFEGLTAEEIEAHYRGLWTETTTPPRLYTVSPSGGKTYVDYPLELRDYQMQYCDGAALYGIREDVSYVSDQKSNADPVQACRVALATGEVENFTLLPTENFVSACGDKLLTRRFVTDAPLPSDHEQFEAAIQSATVEFDLLDPRTGERTKVRDVPYNTDESYWNTTSYAGYHNGKLYFKRLDTTAADGNRVQGLAAYDAANGTTETVWDTWPAEGWEFRGNMMPMQGDKAEPYIIMSRSSPESGDGLSAIWNVAADTITPVTQTVEDDSWDYRVFERAQTADGRWLVAIRYDKSTGRYGYGIISPEQLAAGSTDWQEVTMWGI